MDIKKQAAEKAIEFIKNKSSIGLGAGSTMAHMVEFLADKIHTGFNVTVFTSSFSTNQLLLQKRITVSPISKVSALDIYFDGCDQLDKHLNAIKSGGGIHTREKLFAAMAQEFILVGDETKYRDEFDDSFPIVIELLPDALHFVIASIGKLFPGARSVLRMSHKKHGAAITEHGNYLIDIWFGNLPELKIINPLLKEITGVVETSLFYNMAHKAILATNDGMRILERSI